MNFDIKDFPYEKQKIRQKLSVLFRYYVYKNILREGILYFKTP
jgi:hypothetical protein